VLGDIKYQVLIPGSEVMWYQLLELVLFYTGYCHMATWPGSILVVLQYLSHLKT